MPSLTPIPDRLRLPTAPAWFAHRAGGERRLGVVVPAALELEYYDLGVQDELALLAADRLDATSLNSWLARSPRLPAPVVFDVPVARPSKILGLGKNFAAHAAEFGAAVPEEPVFFAKLQDSLLPHQGTIVLPWWLDSRVDHEIELGVILGFEDPAGRGVKHVPASHAMDLVAGYTVLNDVTARQLQGDDRRAQRPWLRSKSFDTFCPLGPWVVPRDSLPGIADVALALWVNDSVRQSSRTAQWVVGIAEALAFLSRHTTLRPGDILAMGTPEGVGELRPGDQVVGMIEGIGALANDVARERTPA